jgi:hypothetical protein
MVERVALAERDASRHRHAIRKRVMMFRDDRLARRRSWIDSGGVTPAIFASRP